MGDDVFSGGATGTMAAGALGERLMRWNLGYCGGLAIAGSFWVVSVLVHPGLTHNVEVVGDVAGTWHIEPDHSPKAGEPAQVWIALTRQGGAILPLEQADCRLSLYNAPRTPEDQPILQPMLEAIAAEQYQGIPGATVTFPKTGLYQFSLDCSPKTAGDFQPFQMTYDVTVASGSSVAPVAPDAASPATPVPETTTSAPPSPLDATQPDEKTANSNPGSSSALLWTIVGGIIAVPLALGIGRLLTKR